RGALGVEPPRRLQQQRGCIAPAIRRERDLGPEYIDLCTIELVEWSGLRGCHQSQRGAEETCVVKGLRCSQCTSRPQGGVEGERRSSFQERGRGRHPAARLRTGRRAL